MSDGTAWSRHCWDSTCFGWSSERDARRGVHHGRVSRPWRAGPRQGASARGYPRRALLRAAGPAHLAQATLVLL